MSLVVRAVILVLTFGIKDGLKKSPRGFYIYNVKFSEEMRMAKVIYGEFEFSNRNMGQLSDLICIFVTNGYIVEITPIQEEQKIIVTIMEKIN